MRLKRRDWFRMILYPLVVAVQVGAIIVDRHSWWIVGNIFFALVFIYQTIATYRREFRRGRE